MIRPPSLQADYDLISASDEAVNAPPIDSADDVKKAHDEKLKVARETGDWTGLLVEGKQPTKFTCRLIPQALVRRLKDKVRANEIGTEEYLGLSFRMAVKDISNFGGYKVRPVNDPDWGAIASAEVLDALPTTVVSEIGLMALARSHDRPL